MRQALLLVGLSMMAVLMFTPAASAEHRYGCPHDKPFVAVAPGSLGEESLRCFATRAEADRYSETGSTASPTPSPPPSPSQSPTASPGPSATASPSPGPTASPTAGASALPATGGGVSPTLVLGPLALIVGGGLLAIRIVRR